MIVFLLIGMMLFFSAQNASYYMEKNVESVTENDSVVTKKPMAAIADADVQLIWNRTWGGLWYDIGLSIWNNGTSLYTIGRVANLGTGGDDFGLVKWDTDGNILWTRIWGGSNHDGGESIWGDGTYIYTSGFTESFGAGSADVALVKWDADGNILWNRTWGGSNIENAYSLWGDGTYLYTFGLTESFGEGAYDLLLLKWDTDGNNIWNRTWGYGGWSSAWSYEWASSIRGDGTYLYTLGHSRDYATGIHKLVLVKWDTDGNLFWNRTWDAPDQDIDFGQSVYVDGTYLYTLGTTPKVGEDLCDFALMKWDTDGNVLWNRTWGGSGPDTGKSMYGDGTYLYTLGTTDSFGAGGFDFALVQWDTDGNALWNRTWGGPGPDIAHSLWANETHFYALGETASFALGGDYSDYALVKWGKDITNPVITTPDDIGYEQGATGNTISWTSTDTNPGTYVIYKDSVEIEFDHWASGVPITISVDGLSLGEYNYTILVYDEFSNSVQDTVIVTVQDTTNPILNSPTDIAYEEGTTGYNITWTSTDNNPGTYIIYKDSVEIASGTWTSGVPITISIDGLSPGGYNYTIIVYDEFNNLAQDTVIVTVQDTTNPVLSSPADITYEESTTGHNIAWTGADANPGTYIIYKDSVEIASDTWTSGVPITISIDGLSVGSYDYTIIVYDESNDLAQDTVIVTVEDTTDPILSSPADITYEESTTGHNIAWDSTDNNPGTYVIYKDNVEIYSGAWTSGVPIAISVDGLSIGSYNYTIIVYDEFDNFAQDTVIVTAQDTANPILSSPADIAYEESITGHNIAWTSTDNNPDTYIIYKDSVEIASGTWTSGVPITISIDGLSPGEYNYTIVVYDEFDNLAQDTVIVTVTAAVTGGDAINPLVIPLAIIIPVASVAIIAVIVIRKRKAKIS